MNAILFTLLLLLLQGDKVTAYVSGYGHGLVNKVQPFEILKLITNGKLYCRN
jgi:hypothetical protein